MNVGEIDFTIVSIYMEDPLTGERGCFQDGVRLWPCIDHKVNALQTKVFTLEYTSDFAVSEVRKTIVFESSDLIQRFPVVIDISAQALATASQYASGDVNLTRPIFGAISTDYFQILFSGLLGSGLWVVFALIQLMNAEDESTRNLNAKNSMQVLANKS